MPDNPGSEDQLIARATACAEALNETGFDQGAQRILNGSAHQPGFGHEVRRCQASLWRGAETGQHACSALGKSLQGGIATAQHGDVAEGSTAFSIRVDAPTVLIRAQRCSQARSS